MSNQVDTLQAHQSAVYALQVFDKYLLSGALNEIQVRDTSSFAVLLQGSAKHAKAAEIKCLALLQKPSCPNPIVVAGDNLGFITLLTVNSAGQPENVTFGAHCEDKHF